MKNFRCNRGVVAIETALLMPVFLLATLGAVVIFQAQSQSSATAYIARAAAFQAAQAVATGQDPQAAALAAFNANASQYIFNATPTLGTVTVNGTLATVTVSATAPALIPIIPGLTTINSSNTATD